RRLLDLDADPVAVDGGLTDDPTLAPLIIATPGRRVPRTVDGDELALRAVLGQQVSTGAARALAGRLAHALGEPVNDPHGGPTRLFPSVGRLADIDPAALPIPRRRQRTFVSLAREIAEGGIDIDVGCDWALARARLAAVPGVGPWTVETIAMRGL